MPQEYAQCLIMDLNKKSGAKPKTIAESKGTSRDSKYRVYQYEMFFSERLQIIEICKQNLV